MPSEICIDGRFKGVDWFLTEGHPYRTAWCVEPHSIVALVGVLGAEGLGGTAIARYSTTAGKVSSVGAILTSPDSHSLIDVQNFEIQAQGADVIGSTAVWRTLNAGDQQCNACSSLSMLTVPEGTERLKVTLGGVPPGMKDGLLYLASVVI